MSSATNSSLSSSFFKLTTGGFVVVFFAVRALVSFVAWYCFWASRSIEEHPVLSSGMAEKMGNAFANKDTEDTSEINGG